MTPEIEPVTLKEAQFLVGRPQDELSRAIERGEVERHSKVVIQPAKPAKKRRSQGLAGRRALRRTSRTMGLELPRTVKRKVLILGEPELLYFSLGPEIAETLTRAGRRKLYDAIRSEPRAKAVRVGVFDVPLKQAAIKLVKRYRALKDLRSGIVEREDQDPLLKGTDLSVYRIAALAEGQGLEETLEDYPGLKAKQLKTALEYARAYPKKGRPYPARSFKRAAAALAASGALSLDTGEPVEITLDRFRDAVSD